MRQRWKFFGYQDGVLSTPEYAPFGVGEWVDHPDSEHAGFVCSASPFAAFRAAMLPGALGQVEVRAFKYQGGADKQCEYWGSVRVTRVRQWQASDTHDLMRLVVDFFYDRASRVLPDIAPPLEGVIGAAHDWLHTLSDEARAEAADAMRQATPGDHGEVEELLRDFWRRLLVVMNPAYDSRLERRVGTWVAKRFRRLEGLPNLGSFAV